MKKINESDPNIVREKVLSGITKMAELVGMTLGPGGLSVIIERGAGEPLTLDDGRRVAENIKLDDPIEQMAVRSCYAVTRKTDEKVGDGTTTSMVLAHAIVAYIFKEYLPIGGIVSSKANVNVIDRRIKEAEYEILTKLDAMAKPVKTEKELIDVATISAGSPEIGEIIGKMYHKLGENGHICLEFNLLSEKIEHEITPGLRFNASYADKWMVTSTDRKESVFVDTHILVVNQKDLNAEKIKPIAKEIQNMGKTNFVILAPRFTPDFLKSIYATAVKGKFAILCVRFPGGGEEHYKDIAVWTGGKYFNDKDDIALASKKDLGYVERIEVTEDDGCVLLGGKGTKEAVDQRIKEVLAEADQQKLPQFKAMRLERASALSGGVGVIRIGAPTDEERNWLKYKIEDAKWATRQAFKGGVVKGGGLAFKEISESLSDENILKEAILSPYIKLKETLGEGFEVTDDVVDPVNVEKAALTNACSAASKLIRLGGAICYKKESLVEELGKLLNKAQAEEELIENDNDNIQ
jgi:chaperonin GroEL